MATTTINKCVIVIMQAEQMLRKKVLHGSPCIGSRLTGL